MREYKYFQFVRSFYYFPHWDETQLSLYNIKAFINNKILKQLDKVIGYGMLKRCKYYE